MHSSNSLSLPKSYYSKVFEYHSQTSKVPRRSKRNLSASFSSFPTHESPPPSKQLSRSCVHIKSKKINLLKDLQSKNKHLPKINIEKNDIDTEIKEEFFNLMTDKAAPITPLSDCKSTPEINGADSLNVKEVDPLPLSSPIGHNEPINFSLERAFYGTNQVNINQTDIFSQYKIYENAKTNIKQGKRYVLALTRDQSNHIQEWDGLGLYQYLLSNGLLNPLNRSLFKDIDFYFIGDLESNQFEHLYSYLESETKTRKSLEPLKLFFIANQDLAIPTNENANIVKYMRTVALEFQEGILLPKNLKETLHWYQEAANRGHFLSCYQTAIMYEDGLGTKPIPELAFKYCLKAVNLGSDNLKYLAWAQARLGEYYRQGIGVNIDKEKSNYYLKDSTANLDQ